MKKINKILISCFIVLIGFTSCTKDSILDPTGCLNGAWVLEVSNELDAWSKASSQYAEDPTKANCDKYKSTGKEYLNALNKIKNCVPGNSKKEFNQSIEDAKKDLDETDCQ